MNVGHMTFSWDSIDGEAGEINDFIADGFSLEKSSVMITDNIVLPKKINDSLVIRTIASEEDWEAVVNNHVHCRANHFDEAPYRKFASRRIADYRLMIKKNKGKWFGAFLDGQLVGDLGIFAENGLGRFQTVGTHPGFRRLGVCSTLLYRAGKHALETMNVKQLVIVADPYYHAAAIYESVGFKTKQTSVGLCKYNKSNWVT
jgi:hypothetical protein